MKIYTRTGDGGTTALFGGRRVSKAHPRVEAYGTLDELNSTLGWSVTQLAQEEIRARVQVVQHDLFALGAYLATPAVEGRTRPKIPDLPRDRAGAMEAWMDAADEELPPLRGFILPGGGPGGAALHVARAVCRRAERAVAALAMEEDVDEAVCVYLNRLSDLLFVFARLENLRTGVSDVTWDKT